MPARTANSASNRNSATLTGESFVSPRATHALIRTPAASHLGQNISVSCQAGCTVADGKCTSTPLVRPAYVRPSAQTRSVSSSTSLWNTPTTTSAASRWWRIALAPGFVEPLCCIASTQHARSPDTRGFSSLSLSNTHNHLAQPILVYTRRSNASISKLRHGHGNAHFRSRQSYCARAAAPAVLRTGKCCYAYDQRHENTSKWLSCRVRGALTGRILRSLVPDLGHNVYIPTSLLAALLRFRVGAFELECNRAANRARGERVCRVCAAGAVED
jgi:hypothetical protein